MILGDKPLIFEVVLSHLSTLGKTTAPLRQAGSEKFI
jgi:hypothetical protein